jgi:starch phosphorylase
MYDGKNGWAIPTADGVEDPDRRDDLEANALYDLMENSVAARFYDRGEDGLPARWLEMVRHTLESLGPKVLASRMVRDYVRELYAPAAVSGRRLDASSRAGARELATWKAEVRRGWSSVAVDHVESSGVGDSPEVGHMLTLRAFVSLGDLSPSDVEVQVVHGRADADDQLSDPVCLSLSHAESYESGRHRFEGDVKLERTGPFGYTVRILPSHPLLASPAELGLVTLPSLDPPPHPTL